MRVTTTDGPGELGGPSRSSSPPAASSPTPTWRREHLGEGWEHAKVRGTPLNTGDMIAAALRSARPRAATGRPATASQWDAWCAGQREQPGAHQPAHPRQSYPLGIIVNATGERFLDEGADFRNYTYAKYGKEILEQPGGVAYQIFDADYRPLLRTEEYDMPGVSVVESPTPSTSWPPASAIDPARAGDDRRRASTRRSTRRSPFDPTIKDGRRADVDPPKSNWARRSRRRRSTPTPSPAASRSPSAACAATPTDGCSTRAGAPIPGLFVCGEMLGGLFSGNYPGGTGLASGAVFGRRAGSLA